MSAAPAIPDPETRVKIDARRYLAYVVDSDGESWPWVLDYSAADHAEVGCECRTCAPHEQLGRLPKDIRRRINQCQAITRTGRKRRCSYPAPVGQEFCPLHAVAAVDQ